jgi:hypothetical protein
VSMGLRFSHRGRSLSVQGALAVRAQADALSAVVAINNFSRFH